MNVKKILEKIFPKTKSIKETKIANLKDFVYIPTRQSLKDKPEVLNLLDSYKKKYNQILSSKRIVLSPDLE